MDRKLAALGTWKRILLVADENTWPVAGATLEKILAGGWTLGKAILPGDGKADEAAVAAVLGAAAAPDLVLAAGAGTLTDVVRHVAAGKWGIPFVSVPTAPSMDGYASAVSAMTFGGFKVTRPARPPLAIYADLAVLAAAPRRLVAAGAADLLGKHTALTDWLLAREMTDEYHCPRIAALVQEAADACGNDCAALRAGKEDAIARLAAGLIVSGIGILMAGSSRPASGSEHHLSHFWEMKAQLEGAAARLHGEKVAAGTVLAAQAYQFLLRQDPGELRFRPRWRTRGLGREQYRRELEESYGPLAAALPVMRTEQLDDETPPPRFAARLAAARSLIDPPAVPALREKLRAAGAPLTPQDLGLPRAWVRQAILHGRETRDRYTVFTLLAQLGLLEQAALELTD